jgi:hypothetical protein
MAVRLVLVESYLAAGTYQTEDSNERFFDSPEFVMAVIDL